MPGEHDIRPEGAQRVVIVHGEEDERWRAHVALHAAAELVAVKAAADVKEALDRAAVEVTGRLNEVRAYINQVLTSHGDLHTADHEALLLARDGIARELQSMNNLREQIGSERAAFATGDFVRTLLAASEARVSALVVAREIEHKSDIQRIDNETRDISRQLQTLNGASVTPSEHAQVIDRLILIEKWQANLNGKLVMAGMATVVGVGIIEFLLKGVKFG
jgi:hypothetical protein